MYIYKNILVGEKVNFRWSKKNTEPLDGLDTIVIHYTAGLSTDGLVRYLSDDYSKVSAHLLIARNGYIWQMVDFNTQAWHAGKSKLGDRENVNRFSIGIELVNAGVLHEKGDDCFYDWSGHKIPDSQVVQQMNVMTDAETGWHDYTEKQLLALKEVCKLLISNFNIKHIVGHSEISLTGKIDPGPAFPMNEFRFLLKTTKKLTTNNSK